MSTRADAAHEADREVDLGDQEHEDDADRDRRDARHLQQQVDEVLRGVEAVVQAARRGSRAPRGPTKIGSAPELARPQPARRTRATPRRRVSPSRLGGGRTLRGALRPGTQRLAHAASVSPGGRTSAAIPGTCASCPAVIAWTTCSWVVLSRLVEGDALAEAQHGDPVGDLEDVVEVVRDEHDGEAPGRRAGARGRAPGASARRRAPRSARRGSRRFEFHITAFATATACRWPPESPATACRTERSVVTERPSSVSRARCSIVGSSSDDPVHLLAAEEHVRRRRRGCRRARGPGRRSRSRGAAASRGPWIVTGSPLEETSRPRRTSGSRRCP